MVSQKEVFHEMGVRTKELHKYNKSNICNYVLIALLVVIAIAMISRLCKKKDEPVKEPKKEIKKSE